MIRREFITLLGGAAVWPLAARAQQGNRVRRIGVLVPYDENEPFVKPYLPAFIQALAGLGWTEGRNVRIDLRWFGDDINRIPALARECTARNPTSFWQMGPRRPLRSSERCGRSQSSTSARATPSLRASSRG